MIFQRQEENVQHGCPESSQTRVVNQVESGNQKPWFGGTGENFARFGVVNYVPHCFPTLPFFGFDGSSTQNRWFWIRHGVVSPLEVASEADNSHFSNNLPIFQPLHSTTGSQQQAVAQKSWASWEKSRDAWTVHCPALCPALALCARTPTKAKYKPVVCVALCICSTVSDKSQILFWSNGTQHVHPLCLGSQQQTVV